MFNADQTSTQKCKLYLIVVKYETVEMLLGSWDRSPFRENPKIPAPKVIITPLVGFLFLIISIFYYSSWNLFSFSVEEKLIEGKHNNFIILPS